MTDRSRTFYPNARRPDRHRVVDSHGIKIATFEWGEPDAPPILAVHGGLDLAATFDLLAPRLADQGWRVISFDQRGHGDSDHAGLYSWEADLRDALSVMNTVSRAPMPVIGHSKGGSLMIHFADAMPHRVSHLINLEGMPAHLPASDVMEHERTRMRGTDLTNWLDHRRSLGLAQRKPGSLDDLARRRQRMNPRLPLNWLRYIATIGAFEDGDGGWRWKLDASLRPGGFGPWRPQWTLLRLPGLDLRFLGIMGLEIEQMSWHTTPDEIRPYLPAGGRLDALADTGHFLHIERPDEVAGRIIEFLGSE